MTDEFTITNVKNMSNEKAEEMNKVAQYLKDISGILEGQKEKPHRDEGVAHREYKVDKEVTLVYYKAVKGVSTIKDEEYASFVNPISTINFDNALQNVRKGNYGYMKETKTSQKSTNVYMRKYGLSIEVKPTLTEKRNVTEFIKATNWKRGNDYKKERVGPDDYEISIDKNGKGSVTLYKDNKKLKTIEFKIDKDDKIVFDMVKLYQILEDGWLGVETLRALSVSLNHLAETNRVKETVAMAVEKPVEETNVIKLGLSTTKYYSEKFSLYKGATEKAFGKEMEDVYKRASKMDYETESNLRRGGTQEITDPNGFYEKYFKRGEGINEEFNKEVIQPFLEKYPENEKIIPNGFISTEKLNGKSTKFTVDLQEMDKDFDYMISQVNKNIPLEHRKNHLELIETYRDYIKERIKSISKESKNAEDFLNNLNADKAHSIYLGLLTNYCNMPGEINIFETVYGSYPIASSLLKNNEDKKRLKKFKIEGSNDFNIQDMKNSLFKKDRELYYYLSAKMVDYAIDVIENPHKQNIAESIPSKDKNIEDLSTKKEDKQVEKSAIVKMMPKKSPSQKELDDLKISVKESLTLSEMYIDWFNEGAKKSGINKRLTGKNPTELFDKMGIDFWEALKDPTFMGKYEKKLFSNQESKEFREFEKYVKMRSYDLKTGFDMGFDLKKQEDLHVAVQLYGEGFIKDREKIKHDIKDTIWRINKDKVECGAFQIFVNKYHGKKKLVEDNIIGEKTESYMYDKNGQPSFLLTLYSIQRNQDTKEINKLLDQASKNEKKRNTAKT